VIRLSCELSGRQSQNDHSHLAGHDQQYHPVEPIAGHDQQYRPVEPNLDDMESANAAAEKNFDDSFVVDGDPTETCMVNLAVKYCSSAEALRLLLTSATRHDEMPFDSSTKYMATVHDLDVTTLGMLKETMSSTEWVKCPGGQIEFLFLLLQ
jgi:magnesium-transporting ATPase (P-type)